MADTEDGTSALIKTEREEPDTDEQTQPETRKISRRITVEPLLVFYFMAFAPSVPLYEQYVYQQISERHNFSVEKNDTSVCYIDTNSTEYKREQIVQSESSHWLMYFTVASIIPTTLVMVLIGPYTDQRGRKIAMYAPLIGAIGKLILTTTIVGLHLPFELILVGCVIDGLSGGIVAFVMACFAYIADITTVTRRAIRIFLLEVAIGVGVVLSDVGIGYAIKLLGYFYPFLILLSINVLNLLYTHFAVEESIIKKDNVKFFTAKHVKQTLLLYTKNDDTNRRWKIWIVMVILLLIGCIDFGNTDIQTYKLLKTPLCFTSVLVGYFTAANYAIKICIGVLFLKLTFRYLKEVWIIILACSSAAAFNFIFPFATTRLFAFLSLLASCLSSLSIPMIRSYSSKLVTAREQGTLMASIGWIQSVAALVGNATLNSIYSTTLAFDNGMFAFFVAATFYITAEILATILLIGKYRENKMRNLLLDTH